MLLSRGLQQARLVLLYIKVSDDEDTLMETQVDTQTTVKPSFKKIKFTKARNESVKFDKQADKPKMVTQNSKGNPQQALKYKGMFDGFAAFGGSTKGGKTTADDAAGKEKV
nr:hypothetical protein [Tanacetum cinerariifolium]